MKIKRIIASFIMSFSLGFLFYLISASILVDLPGWALSAEIRGRQLNIINHIMKPFVGIPPDGRIWTFSDSFAVIIVWFLAGLIGGFAGKDKFEGGIGTLIAFVFAASIGIFSGTPISGTDPVNSETYVVLLYRLDTFILYDGFFRVLIFMFIAFLSGFYFGYLGKLDNKKMSDFWKQLDDRSHKIKLPFICNTCQTSIDSNPIFCINCGTKLREEVENPII